MTRLHVKMVLGLPQRVGTPWVGTPWAGTPWVGTPWVGTPWVGTPWVGTPWVGTPWVGGQQKARGGHYTVDSINTQAVDIPRKMFL